MRALYWGFWMPPLHKRQPVKLILEDVTLEDVLHRPFVGKGYSGRRRTGGEASTRPQEPNAIQ